MDAVRRAQGPDEHGRAHRRAGLGRGGLGRGPGPAGGTDAASAAASSPLVAAAMHGTPAGLAAYTVLNWRPGGPWRRVTSRTPWWPRSTADTGWACWSKLANLRLAQQRWPAARSVLTWNASENQHMLAINIALGFKPAGYEGEWQKRLG